MPIYLIIDGIAIAGNTPFGMPVDVISESISEVPDALAQFTPISLSFPFTTALPVLMHAGAINQLHNMVVNFTALNQEGLEAAYMKFNLTSALISSLEVSCGTTGLPYITMSLTWATMQVQTIGVGGTNESFTF